MGHLRLLLGKELRAMLREPMVVITILMPFIIYSSMAPFYGSMTKQMREATRLRGVKLALLECRVDSFTAALLEKALKSLEKANATIVVEKGCNGLGYLEQGFDVVFVVNGSIATGINATVYVAGSVERLARTLALPSAAASAVGGALREAGGPRFNTVSYVYLNGRLYSFDELNTMFGSMISLAYISFFILFPAASLGAAMVGAEREERMLEVLLSLPLRRRDIAFSKAIAAVLVAALTAVSALAGMLVMMGSVSLEIPLTKYYTAGDLAVYVAALLAEALFIVMAAMIVGLFASTIRGAQSASVIAVIPAVIPPIMVMSGVPVSFRTAVLPYTALLYASLAPLTGRSLALASTLAQLVEAAAVTLVFIKLLESETVVTGPETVRRMLRKLRRHQ